MNHVVRSKVLREVEIASAQGRCLASRETEYPEALMSLARRGEIVSPHRGLWALPSWWSCLDPLEQARMKMRTLSWMHPSWVFCAQSAAVMHGLEVSFDAASKLCIATGCRSTHMGKMSVSRVFLKCDYPVVVDGVVATPFDQTICDCTRLMPFDQALAVADSALRLGGVTGSELIGIVSHEAFHKRGAAQARLVASLADGRSENGGESIARAHMYELGYAVPDLQVEVRDPIEPSRSYRFDYLWKTRDGLVAGELDGFAKYTDAAMMGVRDTAQVIVDERRRESRIHAAIDVRFLRFSYAEACDLRFFDELLSTYGIPRR